MATVATAIMAVVVTVQTVVQDEAMEERVAVATEARVAMEALPIVAEAEAVAMA